MNVKGKENTGSLESKEKEQTSPFTPLASEPKSSCFVCSITLPYSCASPDEKPKKNVMEKPDLYDCNERSECKECGGATSNPSPVKNIANFF